jgi:hypothetical protein
MGTLFVILWGVSLCFAGILWRSTLWCWVFVALAMIFGFVVDINYEVVPKE